jgi:hypothetical protein
MIAGSFGSYLREVPAIMKAARWVGRRAGMAGDVWDWRGDVRDWAERHSGLAGRHSGQAGREWE